MTAAGNGSAAYNWQKGLRDGSLELSETQIVRFRRESTHASDMAHEALAEHGCYH